MKMDRLQLWGLFGLIVLTAAQNTTDMPDHQRSYLVLAPNVIQPGVPVSVSVTVLIDRVINVSTRIVHGNRTLASQSSLVEGGTTELLTLPPILEDMSGYKRYLMLEVQGRVGNVQIFSESTWLRVNLEGFSIFIQTDKLNYLPGQAVKIRVVSINPDGKPHTSPIDIAIRNPRGYLIRQWLAADSVLGVVSKEFDLSDNPPLGVWSITAKAPGIYSSKSFHVAHYVLPKFEVMIEAPDVIYREDPLEGFVTAKYLYGKPVQGHMNLTFIHHVHGMDEVYREDREIDGTEDFEFEVPNYHPVNQNPQKFSLYQLHVEHLTIVAQVTETLTGLTYNSSVKVSVAKSRYKLSFEEYPRILKPSLSFNAKIKISTYNGEQLSLEDQQKTVQVSVMQPEKIPWSWTMGATERIVVQEVDTDSSGMGSEEIKSVEMQLPVPADGVIPLHIEINNETHVLSIDASFEDSEDTLMLYRKYGSSLHTYMQIHKPSSPAKVGSPLHLQIERNFPMMDLHYIVKSKDQVVSAGTSTDTPNLTLVPEVSWAPMAYIIVYCVHPTGEIVSDLIHVPITPVLQNKVSLSWSKTMARPAEDVTLNIAVAEPNSLVGILVVDKATRLAGSHNDITTETVLKEMKESDFSLGYTLGEPYSVFETCDLVVLSDVTFHYHELFPGWPVDGIVPLFVGSSQAVEDYQEEQQEPHERQNFPETWIWMDVNTSDSNTKEIPLTVPDSITSWTATAFVMSESLGLGLVEQPAKLTVFQDFFLSLNLPACIIRGEELVLEIILFNYLQQQLEVSVIVAQSDTFEFIFPNNEDLPMPAMRKVTVESDSGASILIPIRPLIIGEIPISVKATSSAGSDLVRTTVLVKAEGIEQLFSKSLLFELSPSESSISRNITFTFPPDTVEDSQRVTVTAIGDILGPSISGLNSLIRMPYGCGEQNMINFAPNIYVLQYLNATQQADQNTVDRATDFMMKGYVRELSYQRRDGSFSAFGERDSSGSTWLSAFVLRCFLQARPFISIDPLVLRRAAAWIAAQQAADGSFQEPGRVIHTELQGGLDGPVSLTAYVLIALLEDSNIRAQYDSEVMAALMYLEARLAVGVSSSYGLSLLTYALALDGSSNAQTALNNLTARAEEIDGGLEWSSTHGGVSSSWQPRSADIEMASYVLLTLHELGLVTQGLGLMKWLSRQRNDRGGFGSTQDTVVALQALATYAALGGSNGTDVTIRVNNNVTTVATFYINQENYLLHQSQQIDPGNELNLLVTAEGRGLALFQLNVFYNIRNEELRRRRRNAGEHEPFDLDISLYDEEKDSALLDICYSLSHDVGLNMTGMAIMEVGLPSGFSLAPEGIQTDEVVKNVETQPGKVILYLDSVTTSEMCLEIHLKMESRVAKVQGATVRLYDYYEPRRITETMYETYRISKTDICSFCGDDCSQCKEEPQLPGNAAPSSRLHLLPAVLLLFIVFSM